ncbi:C-C motif chemokine 19 [Heteronotia binoei]|uniref:C-C motif chemokine 19 n=1 Tax=Heteronotia binoei TaxID=13085 RepID=UPI00292DB213|nr:C-C motif chemokine 19 [Heteronotia binoei]
MLAASSHLSAPNMAHLGWLLCLAAIFCCSVLQVGSFYQVTDCCLRTSPQPIPFKILRGYRDQQIQEGCHIRAVVFITVKGRQLCAPPYAPWVKKLKERLDGHQKRSSLTYP